MPVTLLLSPRRNIGLIEHGVEFTSKFALKMLDERKKGACGQISNQREAWDPIVVTERTGGADET